MWLSSELDLVEPSWHTCWQSNTESLELRLRSFWIIWINAFSWLSAKHPFTQEGLPHWSHAIQEVAQQLWCLAGGAPTLKGWPLWRMVSGLKDWGRCEDCLTYSKISYWMNSILGTIDRNQQLDLRQILVIEWLFILKAAAFKNIEDRTTGQRSADAQLVSRNQWY